MDPKYKTVILLIIIFFIAGAVVGYVAHRPATVVRTEYINQTIEVPKVTVTEKIVYITATPTISAPTPAPTGTIVPAETIVPGSGFNVRNYNPSTDMPTKTIELTNWHAAPNTISIHPGDTVLIKITDITLQSPLMLTLDSYTKNLGTDGAAFITFNRKGTYNFKAVVASSSPNILPRTYGEGTISVY